MGAASLSLGPIAAQTSTPSISNQQYNANIHKPLMVMAYFLQEAYPTYSYFSYNPAYTDVATWGFWYSNESFTAKQGIAQINEYQNRSGWGTEILSGNVLPKIHPKFNNSVKSDWFMNGGNLANVKNKLENGNPKWGALYWGGGLGMGFYGRGNRNNVTLNTVREDSGYTYLNSQSINFWAKLHYEKKHGQFYPFASVAVGPRIYITNQQVYTYLTLTDYESPTANTVFSDAVWATEFTLGTKWKVSNGVSFMISTSLINGGDVTLVNKELSTFNGLAHILVKERVSSNQIQWKAGVVFDLSGSRTHRYQTANKRIDTIWYFKEMPPPPQDTLIYDSSLKEYVRVRYYVCPCCLPSQSAIIQSETPINPNPNSSSEMVLPRNQGSPVYISPSPSQNQPYPNSGFIDNFPNNNRNSSNGSNGFENNTVRDRSNSSSQPRQKMPAPTISAPKIKN